jgi:hypothetical protein
VCVRARARVLWLSAGGARGRGVPPVVLSQALAATTKKCPRCKTPTEKNHGCNHMTCAMRGADGQICGCDWCWICGRDIGPCCGGGGTGAYPRHYAWWNVLGCPGTQMMDGFQEYGSCKSACFKCGLCLYRVLAVPFAAIAVVLVLALAVAVLGIGIACIPSLLISLPIVACCTTCCDSDFSFRDADLECVTATRAPLFSHPSPLIDALRVSSPGGRFWLLALFWPAILVLGLACLAIALAFVLVAIALYFGTFIPAAILGVPIACLILRCNGDSFSDIGSDDKKAFVLLSTGWIALIPLFVIALALAIVLCPCITLVIFMDYDS